MFLLTGDTLALVDTGFKGRSAHILREITRLGYSPTDVKTIIITHHHADHVGSLAALKKATGASVASHPADAPYIDGRLPQPGPVRPEWLGDTLAPLHAMWDSIPVSLDTLLNDGDELPIGGGLRILHTPGHTPGSISLYLQQEKLVIVGDLLSNTRGLSLPSRAFSIDILQEIASIKRLATLDFDIICFGHGVPIRRAARQTVLNLAGKIERKYRRAVSHR